MTIVLVFWLLVFINVVWAVINLVCVFVLDEISITEVGRMVVFWSLRIIESIGVLLMVSNIIAFNNS